MNSVIEFFFKKYRVTLITFLFLLIGGVLSYVSIPKESFPDIKIPIIVIDVNLNGATPEDMDNQVVKELEKELKNIDNIKQMSSSSKFGKSTTKVEFNSNIIIKDALADVRDRVDRAKANMPRDIDEIKVKGVSINDQVPAINIVISGKMSNMALSLIADRMKDEIERVKGVSRVDMYGFQEGILEILIEPDVIESYDLNLSDVINTFNNNNTMVSSGNVENDTGKFNIKVDGLIDNYKDFFSAPVKSTGDTVVKLGDIAVIKPSMQDPKSFSRINGNTAITLNVKKRAGDNLLKTVGAAKYIAKEFEKEIPTINVAFIGDQSKEVESSLNDLLNNIVLSVLLVVIVILFLLGPKQSFLVSLAIPASFLIGILCLYVSGFTINTVVLFGLTMSIGLLVDGAIVVVEYAEKLEQSGVPRSDAFLAASKRMCWPIIASTLTTLAAFFPLVFWGGRTGEFIKYLPITIIYILSISLFVSLIVIPVFGHLINRNTNPLKGKKSGNEGFYISKWYSRLIDLVLRHPKKTILLSVCYSIMVLFLYSNFNAGIVFFPKKEPSTLTLKTTMPGNYSLNEKIKINNKADKVLFDVSGVKYISTSTVHNNDIIGESYIDLEDWDKREKAVVIIEKMNKKLSSIAGVKTEVKASEGGPGSSESDIVVNIASNNSKVLREDFHKIFNILKNHPKLINQKSDADFLGLDWEYQIDRVKAERLGVNVMLVGNYIRMATNGLTLTSYTPSGKNEKEDVILRFPVEKRTISEIDKIKIKSSNGFISISDVVTKKPIPKVIDINRLEGEQVIKFNLDVVPSFNVFAVNKEILGIIRENMSPSTKIIEKGNAQQQKDSMTFLIKAFMVSLVIMTMILLIQFNSFGQVFIVMSAIIFSTIGVFQFLMLTQNPFGIIMGGIGIISLAGIIINNNIVLIDTFNSEYSDGKSLVQAITDTANSRLRPIILTTITTIFGLLPMFFQINVDFINLDYQIGAPSSQTWQQLSAVIIGGIIFASFITLIITPCMLYVQNSKKEKLRISKKHSY